MTFADSRKKILDALRNHGWRTSPTLKIPHATDPTGRFRYYFKPRSIQLDIGPSFSLTNSRSVWCDPKSVAGQDAEQITSRLLDVANDYSKF